MRLFSVRLARQVRTRPPLSSAAARGSRPRSRPRRPGSAAGRRSSRPARAAAPRPRCSWPAGRKSGWCPRPDAVPPRSASVRVAAHIERAVERDPAAARQRDQLRHARLVQRSVRPKHADHDPIRPQRGKAPDLPPQQLELLLNTGNPRNRGRSSTRIGISTRLRTMRNRSSSGEVPPITRFAHSSSRIAPPRAALTADSTESTHTSSTRAMSHPSLYQGASRPIAPRPVRRSYLLSVYHAPQPRSTPPRRGISSEEDLCLFAGKTV